MIHEEIQDFYDRQFHEWPEVHDRYRALASTHRRTIMLPGVELPIIIQHNPSRMVSTGAATDAASIANRPCFLCQGNRPHQQIIGTALEGWDILINPFPILPVHFTIACKEHIPQGEFPLDAVEFVDRFPGLCAFFNGARAGASAPDHLHFQAVLKDELPLLRAIEHLHPAEKSERRNIMSLHVPMVSMVIMPDLNGMKLLAELPKIHGRDSATGHSDAALVNTFVWKDNSGFLRAVAIPRGKHRPECYFADGDHKILVSPGALDMAGMIITPRKVDFDRITPEIAQKIYSECSSPL